MVKTLIGFQAATGDRVETIAYTGSSGCAIFQVCQHTKKGIVLSLKFNLLSDAIDHAIIQLTE